MNGESWLSHSSGEAYRLAPPLISILDQIMTMDEMTIIKAEENKLSTITMTFMIESIVYILLDHKNQYSIKLKNSISHQIHTNLSKHFFYFA